MAVRLTVVQQAISGARDIEGTTIQNINQA
jgi:hypothetical protein